MTDRRRVTTRRLVREFSEGRLMVGLARKYGLTRLRVEDRIRQWTRRAPRG